MFLPNKLWRLLYENFNEFKNIGYIGRNVMLGVYKKLILEKQTQSIWLINS